MCISEMHPRQGDKHNGDALTSLFDHHTLLMLTRRCHADDGIMLNKLGWRPTRALRVSAQWVHRVANSLRDQLPASSARPALSTAGSGRWG